MRNLFRAAALAVALAFSALAETRFLPTRTVSVGTSATALATRTGHSLVRVVNNDAGKILYVSFDSAVTTSTGDPIAPGAWLMYTDVAEGQLLYGVAASGTIDARVTEGFSR